MFHSQPDYVLQAGVGKNRLSGALGRDAVGSRACSALALLLLWALWPSRIWAQQEIDVNKDFDPNGWPKPIPVSISGFSGEVDSVLKNDLLFMGFTAVAPESAKYLVTGSNAGRVEGRVVEKINKNQILAKAYTGGSTRSQTHMLADDIAMAITHKPGIAQTKVAFKGETGRGNGEIYISDYDGHSAQAASHTRSNHHRRPLLGRAFNTLLLFLQVGSAENFLAPTHQWHAQAGHSLPRGKHQPGHFTRR